MINVHTKFEVFMFTLHYEDMKDNTKCRNWGGLGWRLGVTLGVTQGHRHCLHSIECLLFDFYRNYASVLFRFRVLASYLSKVAYFNLPHLHLSPTLG